MICDNLTLLWGSFYQNHSHAWYLLDLSRCASECVYLFLWFLSWPIFDIHFEYFSFDSLWLTHPYLVVLEGFKYVMISCVKNLTHFTLCHLLTRIYPFVAQGEILLSPSLILIWNVLLSIDERAWKHPNLLLLSLLTRKSQAKGLSCWTHSTISKVES